MNTSKDYIFNLLSNAILKLKNNKNIGFFTLSKVLEIILKFLLIILLPIIYGFIGTAYIQTFLTLVFLISVLLIAGSDNWLLKKMTQLNLSQQVAFKDLNDSTFLSLKLSFLILIILVATQLLQINNLPIKVIKENWISIFISSISFSIIYNLSWSFRGLGKILLSQLLAGLYWPAILVSIVAFDYLFKNIYLSETKIINLFTFFIFLPIPFYYFYFYEFVKKNISKKKEIRITKSSSSNYSKLNFFLQSASSVGINWLPIFFAGFFLNDSDVGIFSTTYRIGFGIFTALIIINFISAKNISKLFQTSSTVKLDSEYKHFSIISSILGILLFLSAIIIVNILKVYTPYFINIYQILFFMLLTFCTFFGPTDMILNLCNQEKLNKNISLLTLISIMVLFCLSTKFLGINAGYILLGIILFLKYLISFYYVRLKILKI